jgi:N-acetyl-1-D-myo-inositol-2-amino-2-deoxy-alpha-D-glucopyranoside deacetylase
MSADAGRDPWALLDGAGTVLAVHDHPDDESLSTGALLAALAATGTRVVLVTATRGEEGEVVPGAIADGDERALEEIREQEIEAATAALGIAERHWLGAAPALAPGAAPRRYRDSGMAWVREGLAGPSPTAGPDSFSLAPLEQAADDLVALIAQVRPAALIGYDDEGTYGHPDHVRAHHVAVAAAARTGVPLVQIASDADAEGTATREHPAVAETVARAVDSYRTQLTLLGPAEGGLAIRHVGGQDDVVALRTGLRTG